MLILVSGYLRRIQEDIRRHLDIICIYISVHEQVWISAHFFLFFKFPSFCLYPFTEKGKII